MTTYVIKRVLLMIPTLLGISVIVFAMVRWAPGNPVLMDIRGEAGAVNVKLMPDADLIKMRERMYGLDKPIPVQYAQWLKRVVTLDLGESITEHRPVKQMIGERIGLTIKLNLLAAILGYVISIPLGLMAAKARFASKVRRFFFDTSSGVVLLVLYSLPSIFVGTLLIVLFSRGGVVADWIEVNHPAWSWLIMPIGGVSSPKVDELPFWAYFRDMARHYVLPVMTLTITGLAFEAKLARTALLENLRLDYVRTAYAKGLRERTVVYVHALRNSLLPMITVMVSILPGIISGTVIVEQIFNLPGMGQLFWQAVTRRDYEMIQAISIIGAVLTLVELLVADILYAVVDPRVRYD